MKHDLSRLRILAPLTGLALLLTLSAASAQQRSPVTGVGAVHPPFRPPVQTAKPSVIQTGVGSERTPEEVKPTQPAHSQRDRRGNQGYNYPTNGAGYPVYPGPNVPLPAQGTYYANPYGYYNNPYDPYNYNSSGGFNQGYSNGGSYYQQGSNPYGPTYPAFRGYNEGNRP